MLASNNMKSFKIKPFVAGTVFLLYIICSSTTDESSFGNGMCSRTVSNVVYKQHQYSKTYFCFFGWLFCRRVISKKLSFVFYSRETSVCCLGYRKTADGLCEPYCDNCTFPKKCIKPNTCVLCPKGWSGQNCTEDIDECKVENGGCEHICKNTIGSYICSCMQQYLLTDDKHNCTVVDEISSGSQSGTSITIIGGVAGVLVFLLLLIVTVIIVVLIYKAVKQKNNSPYFMNDIASEYERDYHNEIYGTTDCDIYQSEDQLSSGYTEISGERRMQDFSSVTRISNVSLGKSNANFKDKDGYLHLTRF